MFDIWIDLCKKKGNIVIQEFKGHIAQFICVNLSQS